MSSGNPFDDDNLDAEGANQTSDFFSGGSPSCSFKNIGTAHGGKIIAFKESQQTDVETGEPECWPDGNKKMQLIITLQTDERNPDIDEDDGQRKMYVKMPGGIFSAIKKALGKNKFSTGGNLWVKYVRDGERLKKAHNPPKEYEARYTPPGQAVAPISPSPASPELAVAKKRAWNAYIAANPQVSDLKALADVFRKDLALHFGGANTDTLTAEDWDDFVAKDFGATPF